MNTPLRSRALQPLLPLFAAALASALVGCAAPAGEPGVTTDVHDLETCIEPGEQLSSGQTPPTCTGRLSVRSIGMLTASPEGLYGVEQRREILWVSRERTTPERLATVSNALGMTADGTHLYVLNLGQAPANNYEVLAIDRQTGGVRKLAESPHGPGWAFADEPGPIAVSNGTLYWSQCGGGARTANLGAIKSLDLTTPGAQPRTLATGVNCVSSIAVDGTHLYWAGLHDIGRVPLEGGARERFASTSAPDRSQPSPRALTVGDGFVYWSDDAQGSIYRAPTSDGSNPSKVANASPERLTLRGGYLYYAGGLGVSRAAVDGSPAASSEAVVRGNTVSQVAVSGNDLYWYGHRGLFRQALESSGATQNGRE